MVKNSISLLLLVVSVALNLKNGYGTFQAARHPESAKMLAEWGIGVPCLPYIGLSLTAIGLLQLFPKTFLIGNLLSAISFVVIMALALHAGNYRMALTEIPFLCLPLVLIGLKYPFQN